MRKSYGVRTTGVIKGIRKSRLDWRTADGSIVLGSQGRAGVGNRRGTDREGRDNRCRQGSSRRSALEFEFLHGRWSALASRGHDAASRGAGCAYGGRVLIHRAYVYEGEGVCSTAGTGLLSDGDGLDTAETSRASKGPGLREGGRGGACRQKQSVDDIF
jgi:hypothetical protein